MLDINKQEQQILRYWKREKIFQKSLNKTKKGKPFVFFEGPPTANGRPGIHHILARSFKDIILRYQTMKGRYILRKAGWDTHGLPVEIEVEKKIGLKNKAEIETYGIGKFNKEAKKSVWSYKKEWENLTERIGFWLDMKNPYVTYDDSYIETLWWIVKEIWNKGLLYKGFKVTPRCVRCGTALSSHELALGYKETEDNAIYVKFPLVNEKDTYFLVWTTTPWTLPANVALAVGRNIAYVKVKYKGDYLILAEQRAKILMPGAAIIQRFKGKDLETWNYKQLFDFIKIKEENALKVIVAKFVGEEEGTGVVHIAPAFGEDDMEAATQNKLPVLQTVKEDGAFKDEIKPWAGLFVKDADPAIIAELNQKGLLFKQENYKHDYPFCWRCDSPLIYFAKDSWFIKMSSLRKELLKNNETINWIPGYFKQGRFGGWLKEIKDWAISRERFWGTPLPVWLCQTGKFQIPNSKFQTNSKFQIPNFKQCTNIKVIGSIKELEKLSGKKIKDLHRPYVDNIKIKCDKCGGWMLRTPEVMDVWFDSGAMPFAQWHYPFENKKIWQKQFPADYIAEAIDQTRGWFYTLLAVSTLLGFGAPYKNVLVVNMVLDAYGKKMSKSRGNTVSPQEIIEKYGADALRWYFFTINQPAETKQFKEEDVAERLRKFIFTFSNIYSFFEIYCSKKSLPTSLFQREEKLALLDKWILSRLNSVIREVDKNLLEFDIFKAARILDNFVMEDISNWYVRLSRERFRDNQEKEKAVKVLGYVLAETAKLSAPFTPFIAEKIYLGIKKSSVHLESFPKANARLIDEKMEKEMARAKKTVNEALRIREQTGIKVRQPLSLLSIKRSYGREYQELIAREVNVKNIKADLKQKEEALLDTMLTPELIKEGIERELIRVIQVMRKSGGLKPKDKIFLYWSGNERNKDMVKGILEEIKSRVSVKKIELVLPLTEPVSPMAEKRVENSESFLVEKSLNIADGELWLGIKKLKM